MIAATKASWRAWERAREARGCRVQLTHDGIRALTLAEWRRPQVAIVALGGSGFDNCWLAEEKRQMARVPVEIRILVWSGPPGDELPLAMLGTTDSVITASHLSADAVADKVPTIIVPYSGGARN